MEFIGYVIASTQKAFLFQDHYWVNPDWMPKSQVTVYRDDETNEIMMSASPWICGQKKIAEFEHRDENQGVILQEEGEK